MSNTQISWVNPNINAWMQPHMTDADERLLSSAVRMSRLVNKLAKDLLPIDVMPPGAIPLFQEGIVAGPFVAGVTTLFSVPMAQGCEGLVTHRAHYFLGAGLVEGTGGAIWQFKIGNGWAMNCGNMRLSVSEDEGSLVTTNGGYRVVTGQFLTYQVVLTAGQVAALDPAGVLVARIRGWYLPK